MVVEIIEAVMTKFEANTTLRTLLGASGRVFYADPDDDPGFETSPAYLIVYEGDEGYTEEYIKEDPRIEEPDQEMLCIAVATTAKLAAQIRDCLRELIFGRNFETTNYVVREIEYSGSVAIANEEKKDRRKRRGCRFVLKGQYRKSERNLNDW